MSLKNSYDSIVKTSPIWFNRNEYVITIISSDNQASPNTKGEAFLGPSHAAAQESILNQFSF